MKNAILILLWCAVPLAAQNSDLDVLHYRIELDLTKEGIAAETELTIRPVTLPLETVLLDFGALTIDEVAIDGKAAAHERRDRQLAITAQRRTAEPFR
ncbi:MAG TPA: hypothetical protein VHK90_16400, partial [Thermoanaerobaculia bacterium]|nr:hypothetical protein [Thermoanaerobaculia bacterium]